MNINVTDTQLDQLRALLAVHQDVLPDELLTLSFQLGECTALARVKQYISEGHTVRRACEIVSAELQDSIAPDTLRQRFYRKAV